MTDRTPNSSDETPEDVATLYSWANLHGAKYRDFSASRAQTREKARQRVQDATESERLLAEQEAARCAEAGRETAAKALEAEREALSYARESLERAKREIEEGAAQLAAHQRAWHAGQRHGAGPASFNAPRDSYGQARPGWTPGPDSSARPAWLASDRDLPGQPAPNALEDTLQGSRDRITSRWFALNGSSSASPAPPEQSPSNSAPRAPVLAVFSLAGGVGKTSLAATLGRALSARGEKVMLVDTAAYGLLPYYFGARDQRPGVLRTFTPPGSCGDAPIQMLAIDPETLGPDTAHKERLATEIARQGSGANRIIVDIATASGATTRRVLRMGPTILVPVIPDVSSVVSVGAIDSFFQRNGGSGQPVAPFFVLNQFDPSLPLALDVREVLREQLGERLLPFSLRRTQAVSEALAEGMTVMDYAPDSAVAEDFAALASWVKSLAAPGTNSFRGVRWSEK